MPRLDDFVAQGSSAERPVRSLDRFMDRDSTARPRRRGSLDRFIQPDDRPAEQPAAAPISAAPVSPADAERQAEQVRAVREWGQQPEQPGPAAAAPQPQSTPRGIGGWGPMHAWNQSVGAPAAMDPQQQIHSLIAQRNALALQEADSGVKVRPKVTPAPRATTPVEQLVAGTMSGDIQSGKMAELEAMQGEPARLEAMRQEVRLRAAQAAEAGDLAERDRLMAIDMDLRQRISGRIGATEPQESLREKTVPGYASAIAAGQRGFTDTVVASPLSAIDAAAGAMGFDTRMGQSVREGMEAAWPTRPSTEQGFWTGAVPQAAGSAAGFLMTGPLGKAAPLIHGAVVGTGSNYDEARDLDISPTQKTLYTLVGGALGATEGIPIERFIGRLDPGIRQAVTERMLHRLAQEPTKGLTRRVVEEAATQALVESFQEAGQGVGQNIAAKFFGVDPHRNPFDGVSDEALAAMVVGGGMGTMGAVGGEKNRQEILRQYRPQQAGREGQEAADVRTEEQPSAEEGGQLAEGEQAPGDPQRADEGPQEAVDQPPQKTVDSTESTVSSPDADVAAMMEGFDEEIGAAPAPAAESATDTPAAPVAQEPAVPPGDTAGTPRGGPAEIESEVAQAGRKRALDVPGDPGKPPSEFAEGDRVVLPDGTVGTVVKSSTFRMTPIIGGGASAPMTVYDVKTDAGAVRGGFSAERLKPAPARPVGQRGQLAMPGMEAEAEIAEFADRFMPEIERIVGAEVASQYRGPIERYYAAIRRGEDPGQAYGRLYKELPAPATEELDDQLVDVRDRIETEGRADRPAQAETPAAATPVDLDRYEYNVSVADATHPGAPRGQSWITVGRRPKGSTEPFEQVQLIEARGGRTGAMRRAEDAARQYGQSQVFSQFGEGRFVPVGPSKQPLVRIEESAAETSTAPALRIEPYQNAIIVRGETRANKDRIKALGGRWNKRAGGWIFHPSKEAVVREKLGDLLGVRARAHAQPGDALPKYDRGTYRSGPHKGWRYVTVSEGPHKNVIGKGRDLAEAESDLRKVIASREAAKPAAQADVKAPETTEAPEARGVDPHVAARWDAMDYGQREKLAETAYGAMRKVVHRIAGSKWDQLGPGEAQSMAKAMATERPVSAEQAPSLSDKAAAARQELSDAIKEFGDLMDGLAPSNAPLDPRVMKAIGKVIGKSVKAGYYTFAEAMGNVYTQLKAAFGEAKARQMLERAAPTIERAWPAFQQREGRMGPVGRIADIIPTEATDEPGLRGPESAGRPGRGEATGSAEGRRPTPREADTADGEAGTPPQRPPGRPVGDSAEPSGPDGGRGSEPAVGEVAAAGEGPAAPDRGEDRPGVGRPGGKRAGTGRALPDRDVNHIIDPSKPLAPRGNVAKLEANLRAIKLVKKLESENRPATADEKAILARYTGWGWGGELFNEAKWNYRQQREQIQDLLTDEEFASARASALNAHYTSPQVIAPMWDLARRLGFEGGTILEPGMGIGHFFGLMPQDLAAESKLIGVELDSISARIARKLYPQADIRHEGFEKSRIANNSVDLAIGNIPFGGFKLVGKDYQDLLIHDYFFARALDKVKPGGLVIFITSDGTLNKGDASVREMIAAKADLVGAIRLPNDAFQENAGTEVTTDIVVLRKKDNSEFQGERFRDLETVGTATIDDKELPIRANEYFARHPDMALGRHTLEGTMYAAHDYALVSQEGQDTPALLREAIERLPADVMGARGVAISDNAPVDHLAEAGQKEFGYYTHEGTILQVREGKLVEPEWMTQKITGSNPDKPITASTRKSRMSVARDWLGVKDAAVKLLRAENDPGASDSDLADLRKALNSAYDTYKKRWGTLNNPKPRGRLVTDFLADDPEHPLTLALEDESKEYRKGKDGSDQEVVAYAKSKIFTQRIRTPRPMPTRAKDVHDGIAISLAYHNKIDADLVGDLLGVSADQARQQILETGRAFENPATGLIETKEKYLSGNVRQKLREAQAAAETDDRYQANVESLKAVVPADKTLPQISYGLGSRWISPDIFETFINDVLGATGRVRYIKELGKFSVEVGKHSRANSAAISSTYSAGGLDAISILEYGLTGTNPRITTEVTDAQGNKRQILDVDRTNAAVAMLQRLDDAFRTFVATTDQQIEVAGAPLPINQAVERLYNEVNNAVVPAVYHGEYMTLPGMSDVFEPRPHQLAGLSRVLQDGSAVLAHGVGSGKTLLLTMIAMEMRRLGMATKPMIVVANPTINQFAAAFRQAYPDAQVLVADEESFTAANRKRFMSRIALGDHDAVIVAQSQFVRIQDSEDSVRRFFQSRLDELEDAIRAAKAEEGGRSPTVKELERAKKALEAKLNKRLDKLGRRQDQTVTFQDLGVDALLIDEAHDFKKIPIVTSKQRVKGIPSGDSDRAISLQIRVEAIQQAKNGGNIVLATGTPISNSMAEAWVMLKLATPHVLGDYHAGLFDEFANNFGRTNTELELSPSQKWRYVERFNRFINAKELTKMIRAGFDVKIGNEELGLKVPKLRGGKPELVVIPQTPETQAITDYLIEVMDEYEKTADKREVSWVPIVTMGAGMAMSVDPRLIDPSARDNPHSKVNAAIAKVLEIWKDTQEAQGTQIIFADRFKQRDMTLLHDFMGHEGAIVETAPDTDTIEREDRDDAASKAEDAEYAKAGFNLYHDIRDKLVRAGVPAEQIAIIHDFKSDDARGDLFRKMQEGRVRILMGSSEKLGVGVNVQRKLVAIHELDPPGKMRPDMQEQRRGRILRQGNENAEVRIIPYGLEKSMDVGIYQMLEHKQKMVTQALKGDDLGDSFDDVAEEVTMNNSEIKANLIGDPRVLRRAELQHHVRTLLASKSAFENERYRKKSNLDTERAMANGAKLRIQRITHGLEVARRVFGVDPDQWTVEVDGATHTGKEAIEQAIDGLIEQARAAGLAAYEQRAKEFEAKKAAGAVPGDAAMRYNPEHHYKFTQEMQVNGLSAVLALYIDKDYLSRAYFNRLDITDGAGNALRSIDVSSGRGVAQALGNTVGVVERELEKSKGELANHQAQAAALEKALTETWPDDAKLEKTQADLRSLEEELAKEAPKERKRRFGRRAGDEGPASDIRELETPAAGAEVETDPSERLTELEARGAAEVVTDPGQAPPRIQIAPIEHADKAQPLRDVVFDIGEVVGRAVRTGKVPRGAGGVYLPPSARVVIRFAGDVDTSLHEAIGHALDDIYRLGEPWKAPGRRSPYDAELSKFWWHGSARKSGPRAKLAYKRAEGIAEWVRAYVVNPQAAEAQAPTFAAYFKRTVGQETLTEIDRLSEQVRRWAGASAIERTLSNIRVDEPTGITAAVKELVRKEGYEFEVGWWDRFSSAMLDSLAPVWKGAAKARAMRHIDALLPEKDPKIRMRNFAGINDKLEDIQDNGMVTFGGERVANPVSYDGLFSKMDHSSRAAFERDYRDTIALAVSMRAEVRIEVLDQRVAQIKQLHIQAYQLAASAAAEPDPQIKAQMMEDVRKLLREVKKLKASIGYGGPVSKIDQYAKLRRDRMTGAGGGIYSDEATAQQAIKELRADPQRFERLEASAMMLRDWHMHLLRYMLDAGRISMRQYKEIVKANRYYVSFQRLMDDVAPRPAGRPGSKKLGSVAQPIDRFIGSTREMENPYISLLQQTADIVREADRNAALRAFTDLLATDRGLYEGVPQYLASIGAKVSSGEEGAIKVYRNGEIEHWQFQKDIHAALKGLGEDAYGWGMKVASFLPQLMRQAITHSPDFMVRNVIRDSMARYVLSETGSLPWDAAKGYTAEELSQFKIAGGGQAGHYITSRKAYHRELARTMRELVNDGSTILTLPSKLIRGYDRLAKATETVNRMAEYRQAYRKAITPKDQGGLGYDELNARMYAAFEARELIDFAVMGNWMRTINRLIPFTNAAVRGLVRSARAARQHPVGFTTRLALMSVPLVLAEMLWNGDDDETEEEYRQLPDYLRDLYWNFKVGPNLWVRVPKPFELGLMASAMSRAIQQTRGDERAWEGFTGNALHATIPFTDEFLAGPFKSLIESATNHDFFRDRAIVPPYEAQLDLERRKGTERASRLGQVLQRVLGADARKIDHFIQSQFGGIGRLATQATNIGREGRTIMRPLSTGVGVLTASPAASSRDAAWVLDEARRRGKTSAKEIKVLRGYIDRYYAADTQAQRDTIARAVRQMATKIRSQIESGAIWREGGRSRRSGALVP